MGQQACSLVQIFLFIYFLSYHCNIRNFDEQLDIALSKNKKKLARLSIYNTVFHETSRKFYQNA
jgi:hypothetical protein